MTAGGVATRLSFATRATKPPTNESPRGAMLVARVRARGHNFSEGEFGLPPRAFSSLLSGKPFIHPMTPGSRRLIAALVSAPSFGIPTAPKNDRFSLSRRAYLASSLVLSHLMIHRAQASIV